MRRTSFRTLWGMDERKPALKSEGRDKGRKKSKIKSLDKRRKGNLL